MEQGIVWLGIVLETKNPADLCTKNLANIGEFHEKNGIICGSEPFLREQGRPRGPFGGAHASAQVEDEDQKEEELGERQRPQRY